MRKSSLNPEESGPFRARAILCNNIPRADAPWAVESRSVGAARLKERHARSPFPARDWLATIRPWMGLVMPEGQRLRSGQLDHVFGASLFLKGERHDEKSHGVIRSLVGCHRRGGCRCGATGVGFAGRRSCRSFQYPRHHRSESRQDTLLSLTLRRPPGGQRVCTRDHRQLDQSGQAD